MLGGAAIGWRPLDEWGQAPTELARLAGEDMVDVAVVTKADAFEVEPKRMLRPPRSEMRFADLVSLLASQRDVNLTLYTRQAPLWTMPGLLSAVVPHRWMTNLRVLDLNIWAGDGLFRNTLHNDPYDNFLCVLRGTKHVLTFPPEAHDLLYYAKRNDWQAYYLPSVGEIRRRDVGIVSDNTAGVNMAEPDHLAFPLLREALGQSAYTQVHAGDCLYLPRYHHHHVFSEADPQTGYNLAINVWVDRERSLAQGAAPVAEVDELAPTLEQIQAALQRANSCDANGSV
uniref:JmjC domain-containing protein n=1 Tax=Coccolithus braarudii TaxID=221442 RepID=A0A7S0L256_9EUKA